MWDQPSGLVKELIMANEHLIPSNKEIESNSLIFNKIQNLIPNDNGKIIQPSISK